MGLKAACLFQFPVDPFQFFGIESQQIRQRSNGLFLVAQPVRNDIDAKIGLVIGDRLAVAVDQPAAPGRYKRKIDPIALRQKLVTFVLGDRDIGHSGRQQYADSDLQSADYRRSSGEGDLLHGAADRFCRPHDATRQLSIAPISLATNG